MHAWHGLSAQPARPQNAPPTKAHHSATGGSLPSRGTQVAYAHRANGPSHLNTPSRFSITEMGAGYACRSGQGARVRVGPCLHVRGRGRLAAARCWRGPAHRPRLFARWQCHAAAALCCLAEGKPRHGGVVRVADNDRNSAETHGTCFHPPHRVVAGEVLGAWDFGGSQPAGLHSR